MGDALIRYGLFLAETVTIVLALVATVAAVTAILARRARAGREHPAVEVKNLNHRYDDLARAVRDQLLPAPLARAARKQDRKQARAGDRAAKRAARQALP
ncbi:MAG TPA: hypothetical protein VFP72_18725, partial [Kineosporiaceae bacterium]|nr:hypothetical protein [Kineosporiaceae bacterium]